MKKVHTHTYTTKEPIAAIATAIGNGGVAIIRLSGEGVDCIASKIFTKQVNTLPNHVLTYGQIHTLGGQKLDDVLLVYMRGPRSFTGEDVVEIHCHGGHVITKCILETCFDAGARPALPGEFSFRAYMNKKIDLVQAEAIQALIGAKSEKAMRAAEAQLEGSLSTKIKNFQKELIQIAAIIEAWVDFPEEDLEFSPFSEVLDKLHTISHAMQALHDSYNQGKIIQNGIHVSLVGSPNVGKSSLMNLLLGKERAIVSPIAGTTRDIIEDDLSLNGYFIRLLDTAGIRDVCESIEEEGIRRSKKAIETADLILLVLDVTRPDCKHSIDLIQTLPKDKTLVIWNKTDLPHTTPLPQVPFTHCAHLSCMTQEGLNEVHAHIDTIISKSEFHQEETLLTNLRHKEALLRSIEFIKQVITGLQSDVSAEFVSLDIRSALQELGQIIGQDIHESILTAIFSTFCIGK